MDATGPSETLASSKELQSLSLYCVDNGNRFLRNVDIY